jgi:hypothetical protein
MDKPYLGYYLCLVEDDWCGILENNPMSCHFTLWEEELFNIGMISFERLATLLHQDIEGGLEDVALVKVKSVVARVSTLHAWRAWISWFLSGVAKLCSHTEQTETRSPRSKLQKLDYLAWQTGGSGFVGPMAIRGTAELRRGAPPPAKRRLFGGEAWTMTTLMVEAAANRFNRWKEKETRKLEQKV